MDKSTTDFRLTKFIAKLLLSRSTSLQNLTLSGQWRFQYDYFSKISKAFIQYLPVPMLVEQTQLIAKKENVDLRRLYIWIIDKNLSLHCIIDIYSFTSGSFQKVVYLHYFLRYYLRKCFFTIFWVTASLLTSLRLFEYSKPILVGRGLDSFKSSHLQFIEFSSSFGIVVRGSTMVSITVNICPTA